MAAFRDLLIPTLILVFCHTTTCFFSTNSLSQSNLASAFRNNGHLALYPRVGKRYSIPRRDFLSILADKWQRTGSLRGAIQEIQDMTEKRDLEAVENRNKVLSNPPPFILLVRRDLNTNFDFVQQPEESFDGDFTYKFMPRRRNY